MFLFLLNYNEEAYSTAIDTAVYAVFKGKDITRDILNKSTRSLFGYFPYRMLNTHF